MKLFRTVLFWCHLSVGVLAGVVVLVMSVTGVLLTYQRQITAWADVRGVDGAHAFLAATLLVAGTAANPGSGTGWEAEKA
ncbi:hypothetical protein BH23GEM5_BH23GEM5_06000 [soil metagenome]